MNEHRLNRIVAVVFLIVGIMATINTFRLHSYINDTLPRDQAQEKCQSETVAVLTRWVQARGSRDDAADLKDEAALAVMDDAAFGRPINPAEVRAWSDAVHDMRKARQDAAEQLIPLPVC